MTNPRLEWQVQCLQPSFIVNYWLCVFLDLDSGTLDLSLQHWTSHFEAGTSASFILNKKLCLFLDLECRCTCHSNIELVFWWQNMIVSRLGCSDIELAYWNIGLIFPTSDLLFWSWAPFLIRTYVSFWTWKLEHWTCHSSIRLGFWKQV